jgi:hypothetical protein
LLNLNPTSHLGELDTHFLMDEEVISVVERLKKMVAILQLLLQMPLEKELYKWYTNNFGDQGVRQWSLPKVWEMVTSV